MCCKGTPPHHVLQGNTTTPCVAREHHHTMYCKGTPPHHVLQGNTTTPCVAREHHHTMCCKGTPPHHALQGNTTTPCVAREHHHTMCCKRTPPHHALQGNTTTPCVARENHHIMCCKGTPSILLTRMSSLLEASLWKKESWEEPCYSCSVRLEEPTYKITTISRRYIGRILFYLAVPLYFIWLCLYIWFGCAFIEEHQIKFPAIFIFFDWWNVHSWRGKNWGLIFVLIFFFSLLETNHFGKSARTCTTSCYFVINGNCMVEGPIL